MGDNDNMGDGVYEALEAMDGAVQPPTVAQAITRLRAHGFSAEVDVILGRVEAAALLRKQHAEIERLRDELRQSSIDHTRAEVEALRAECRVLVRQNGDWQEKFDALRAERDALRADAERYRWLRERPWFSFAVDQRYGDTGETLEGLDAAIDAARNKT